LGIISPKNNNIKVTAITLTINSNPGMGIWSKINAWSIKIFAIKMMQILINFKKDCVQLWNIWHWRLCLCGEIYLGPYFSLP
jgi:hypothetical protein